MVYIASPAYSSDLHRDTIPGQSPAREIRYVEDSLALQDQVAHATDPEFTHSHPTGAALDTRFDGKFRSCSLSQHNHLIRHKHQKFPPNFHKQDRELYMS